MSRGITFVEVLISASLVAIITIAAIPSFIKSNERTKVSQAKNNLSILAAATEAYRLDHGVYPFDWHSSGWAWYVTDVLSTPVAYVDDVDQINDPFRYDAPSFIPSRMRFVNYPANAAPDPWPPAPYPGPYTTRWFAQDGYSNLILEPAMEKYGSWRLSSSGPDKFASSSFLSNLVIYDPSNGTYSEGDIAYSATGFTK